MKNPTVNEIFQNTDYRTQIITEKFPIGKCYEKTIIFDSDWYETLNDEEANKRYEKIRNKEIMKIRPTKYENGDLGIVIILWND